MTLPRTAYSFGLKAESLAVAFLTLNNYEILKKRYRTPYGEIDIIARSDRMIVCVEVKARHTLSAGMHAIGHQQRKRIMNAYLHFIQTHLEYANDPVRFDVIVCAPNSKPLHIQHAFESDNE
jgi:putative endonuclease